MALSDEGRTMTIIESQDRLSRLSPAKRALLLERLRRETSQGRGGEAVAPRDPVEPAALSFAQQRLWFIEQLAPGSAAYHIAFGVGLKGRLSVEALAAGVREIARRHQVLRTVFQRTERSAEPVVLPSGDGSLSLADLSALPGERREAEAGRLGEEAARTPFDLQRGPLLRSLLIRLREDGHRALFCVHHLVFDGWSQQLFLAELAALYAAGAAGLPSPLPEPSIQYADFAAWQRRHLSEERLRHLVRHWTGLLAGYPRLLELPADRPRPRLQSFAGSVRPVLLEADLAGSLRALSRRREATLFMTLLAAWGALLARLSGQIEVLVGSPVANRQRPELERLIGCFVNTLALPVSTAGDPSFADLVARLRSTALDAYDHQDLPLERLLEELRLDRELSHPPLFQVVFVLQNTPERSAAGGSGLALEPFGVATGSSKLDLVLSLTETPDAVAGHVEYSSALFDAATIDRWIGAFRSLLAGVAAAPDLPWSEAPLLSPAERQALLSWWPYDGPSGAGAGCLHRIFEERAAAAPGAPAVTAEGAALTYEELNRKATGLARHLRRIGVGPEVRVGVCLERSADLLVAILGTLKAGGAYVPLDPSYPAERLGFLAEDSGAPVILTEQGLRDRLPATSARVVCLDEAAADMETAGHTLPGGALPGNAAYVIYTSGSTGSPKGVVVTHANVSRLFTATDAWLRFGADDVWTLFHSYAFDFSVWEIWGALLYGGRLVVVPYLVSRSPEELLALLRRERVTVLNQTPSAFRQLIRAEESAEPGELALRWVIFGGEALEPRSLEPWFDRHGDAAPRLVNMYGITETTVHVTYRPLERGDLQGASVLGVPIPDLRLHVVDRWGQLAPLGVPGEIWVGGAGVARGYLGRPGLTAERFVPDPFGAEPGARLYRSGDLVRLRAGGELEYLGRIDYQVKVRGFRIELGEIEQALAAHPAVAEAVVLLRGEAAAPQLVAYFVVRPGGAEPALDDLRHFLGERLPDHMVPAVFVPLPELPLTAHGKVDRRALPDLDHRRLSGGGHVAPRTLTEEALAAIWAQILGVERVGVHDNFFALGGDSIRSLQVLSLAQERGLSFSLQQLFRHQTIADFAAGVTVASEGEGRLGRGAPFCLISEEDRRLLPADAEDAYPLTVLQAGMLYHMELTPGAPLYHNVDSWHLRAPFDREALRAALQRAVDRHEVLRASFDLTRFSEPLQIVHREVRIDLGVEDLRGLDDTAQEGALAALVRSEKLRPCDLARPPLLRFQVHRRADDRFQLTMAENHAVWDGWSLHATLAEIFEDYAALRRGVAPPERPALSLRFRDFVALEREAIGSP